MITAVTDNVMTVRVSDKADVNPKNGIDEHNITIIIVNIVNTIPQ